MEFRKSSQPCFSEKGEGMKNKFTTPTSICVVLLLLFQVLGALPPKKRKDSISIFVNAPSNGWFLNPEGLLYGNLSHPFGTLWRV